MYVLSLTDGDIFRITTNGAVPTGVSAVPEPAVASLRVGLCSRSCDEARVDASAKPGRRAHLRFHVHHDASTWWQRIEEELAVPLGR